MRIDAKLAEWGMGQIKGVLVNKKTGETRELITRKNIITYRAADIMAQLLGGNLRYAPQFMGFVYGTDASESFTNPESDREHTWEGIATELADVTTKANVLISPFVTAPGYSIDPSDSTKYENNAVTLVAHTGSRLEYAFSTTSGTYAAELQDDGTDAMFQAMLITRLVDGNTITYIPFSRVSLDLDGTYPLKPDGWELSVFWQVTYF